MNFIKYAVTDMNNGIIEKEDIIDLEKVLIDEFDEILRKKFHLFERYGLKISSLNIGLNDQNKLVTWIINYLFPNYDIIDCQYIGILGHPDFVLKDINKKNPSIYLELKIGADTLNKNQLDWFFKNKDKINKVLWIGLNIDLDSKFLKPNNL